MFYKHFVRKFLHNHETEIVPFNASHDGFIEPLGVEELPALRLINEWNKDLFRFAYWLETDEELTARRKRGQK